MSAGSGCIEPIMNGCKQQLFVKQPEQHIDLSDTLTDEAEHLVPTESSQGRAVELFDFADDQDPQRFDVTLKIADGKAQVIVIARAA